MQKLFIVESQCLKSIIGMLEYSKCAVPEMDILGRGTEAALRSSGGRIPSTN
jgi:hypothetical protein